MWGPFLAVALKTSLLMSAAGVACAMLAGRSAAIRHLVWVSALALALLMPLAIALVPPYAVMPDPWHRVEQSVVETSSTTQPAAVAAESSAAKLAETVWPAILGVWLAGALLVLLRDAAGHAGLSRWSRRAHPLRSPHWTA